MRIVARKSCRKCSPELIQDDETDARLMINVHACSMSQLDLDLTLGGAVVGVPSRLQCDAAQHGSICHIWQAEGSTRNNEQTSRPVSLNVSR